MYIPQPPRSATLPLQPPAAALAGSGSGPVAGNGVFLSALRTPEPQQLPLSDSGDALPALQPIVGLFLRLFAHRDGPRDLRLRARDDPPLQQQNTTIGIVIGVVLGIFLVGLALFIWRYRFSIKFAKKKKKKHRKSGSSKSSKASSDGGAPPPPPPPPPEE